MANFEQIPSSSPIEPERQRIFKVLQQYREKERIKLKDFLGIYGDDELRRDEERVLGRRSRHEAVSEESIGVVAEVAFHKNINGGARIFGERARATLLSEYDDYGLADPDEHGAWSDAAIELFPSETEAKEPAHPYRFVAGVDVTANTAPAALKVKLLGIKTSLDTGRLATVKYFKSEEPQFNYRYAGPLREIPRAVVAIDADAAWRVAELTERVEKGEEQAKMHLRNDPMVRISLAELVLQFGAFREYAKQTARDAKTEQKFDFGLENLKKILREKEMPKGRLSDRAVISNPAFRALGGALVALGFRVRSPSDTL